ncbi:MAG: glycosyltransferase [Magnetococcales bacterium]|nr:glycosyltransferase [Magnetococcales bacterium]MBF0322816.1 glycosyltransferase [Magnetococcales bacterium]
MRRVNAVVVTVASLLTICLWAVTNWPLSAPPWPDKVAGVAYSPFQADDNPIENRYPSVEEIDADLAMFQDKVSSVRVYGVDGTLSEIPRLARKYDLSVTMGTWLDQNNLELTDTHIAQLIQLTHANSNIVRVIVGNESLLRGDFNVNAMIAYLDRVRAALPNVPVSTAEPWHIWVKYPQLVDHVDYIAAHFLPYWEGVALEAAVDHVYATRQILAKTYPGKRIFMAEVGWPSNARLRKQAAASVANEALFLRRFLARATENNDDYNLMEAFDQTWKVFTEGSVGAYWGIWDVHRKSKIAMDGPIVAIPHWPWLAAAAIAIGAACYLLLLWDGAFFNIQGRLFLCGVAFLSSNTMVWIANDYLDQYVTFKTIAVGLLLGIGFLGVFLVLLTEAHETAETRWVFQRRRMFHPVLTRLTEQTTPSLPKVSIHVPAYNEPPDMMIDTLNALAKLDYPDYEVLVIDNNTADPGVWQPVEAHCQTLGSRFRFFHVAPLKGFKAGALNHVTALTAPDAEIIAVIDSDYQVSPSWLKDLVPYFARPEIGLVQAPQDYRDSKENPFKSMCYYEYKGFFHIGMVTRNDRNAIIQHGTMTMIRTRLLKELGGWAEWCITEDAELGLRVLEKGFESVYIKDSYGKGLMPDTFVDYKKQRFRWAYGALQIIRRHFREILLGEKSSALTGGQRYHFMAGWLPWLADGINLFYTVAAIIWSIAIVLFPKHVDTPYAIFVTPPVLLFIFKVVKMIYLYRTEIGVTRRHTLAAALSGLALSHTIARAMITGVLTTERPFFRTPKCENRPAMVRALYDSMEELLLLLFLWLSAVGVALVQGEEMPSAYIWSAALFIQSLPYAAAVVVALINALPKPLMNWVYRFRKWSAQWG